jgi:hypothetical protein
LPVPAVGDVPNSGVAVNALANNGGPTQTCALPVGSSAIDGIPNGLSGCGTTFTRDQRFVVRPQPAAGACDVGAYEAFGPTLVELASFTATAAAGGVHLEWETASEIDNAGFNLYRSAGGERVKLNAALIPTQGGPTRGVRYAIDDPEVAFGTTYSYTLEDVDVHGQATLHGPVVIQFKTTPKSVHPRPPRTE